MKRYIFFLLIALFCQVQMMAQTTFCHPLCVCDYGYVEDTFRIQKVELTDTATLIYIKKTVKEDASIFLKQTCYLEDDKGTTYYIKGADGVNIQKEDMVTLVKAPTFTLSFQPLPVETKVFDLHGGNMMHDFHIYGIHDKSYTISTATEAEQVSSEFLQSELSHQGTVCVKGHIENEGNGQPQIWNLQFTDELDIFSSYKKPFMVTPDGKFETTLSLKHPCMALLKLGLARGSREYMLYLYPNDTIDLTIRRDKDGAYLCEYSPSIRHANFLTHYPTWIYISGATDKNKSIDENMASLNTEEENQLRLCNYLGQRYGFTPFEKQLLKNEVRLNLLTRKLGLIFRSNLAKMKELHESGNISYDEALRILPYDQFEEMKQHPDFASSDDSYAFFSNNARLIPIFYDRPLTKAYEEVSYIPGSAEARVARCYEHLDSVLSLYQNEEKVSPFEEAILLRKALEYIWSNLSQLHADKQLMTAVLTQKIQSPYLRSRLPELVDYYANWSEKSSEKLWSESVRDTMTAGYEYAYSVIDSIAGKHKGKYVLISSMYTLNGQWRSPQGQDNLLIDFANSKDIAFVFVVREDQMSQEDFERIRDFQFPSYKDNCFRLSREDWLKLSFLSGNDVASFDYMTLNRKGQPLLKNLPLDETNFRHDLRLLLKEELVGYGYMSEKFRDATAK